MSIRHLAARSRSGHNEVVDLPVMPPVSPMLSEVGAEVPEGASVNRNGMASGRSVFVTAMTWSSAAATSAPRPATSRNRSQQPKWSFQSDVVIDGEIVISAHGRLDFEALQQRIHPPSPGVHAGEASRPRSSRSTCWRCAIRPHRRTILRSSRSAGRGFAGCGPVLSHPGDHRPATAQCWFDELEAAGFTA